MPESIKNALKVGALFLLIIVAVTLYKVILPNVPTNTVNQEGPVIARVAPDLIIVNNRLFQLELANSPQTQEQGLSGRESLDPNKGMLFVFDHPGKWGFWMKEMRFPIDIIWLDQDFKPIYVLENVSPQTYPKTFYPPTPAQYALEINAGAWQEAILSTK